MAKAMLICGKICSGKTWHAKHLMEASAAVLLSIDEILIALFGTQESENLDLNVKNIKEYLYKKSIEITESGIDVILDWGFGSHEERQIATTFYEKNNIAFEWYYIDASDDVLWDNLSKRNHEIEENRLAFFHFDRERAIYHWNAFQIPAKEEIDFWVGKHLNTAVTKPR